MLDITHGVNPLSFYSVRKRCRLSYEFGRCHKPIRYSVPLQMK
ncbi:hypothetical protein DZB91_18595 [Brevibacillus sp. VP]|nr:hypothetical protein DZB91_18595 [Brevibacillus sp. VP]